MLFLVSMGLGEIAKAISQRNGRTRSVYYTASLQGGHLGFGTACSPRASVSAGASYGHEDACLLI